MTNASTAQSREPVDAQEWMRAAGAGDAARIRSLLDAGANVNAALEGGDTALIRATSKGHLPVVRMLLEAGADPNAEREDGFTALGMAVFFGYADIVRALLAGGADRAAKGRLGMTVEKWALFSGFDEIVALLREPGSGDARNSDDAQGSAGGAATNREETGASPFFPTEGAFKSVVPLSKIYEEPAAEVPTTGSAHVEDVERGVERGAAGALVSDEPEVATLVPSRGRGANSPRTPSVVRPKGVRRQSWRVTIVALSVIAGLISGAYLVRSMQSVETSPRENSQSETSRSAPLADADAPAAKVETQVNASQPETAAADAQTSQPASQLPAPGVATEPEPVAAPDAHVAAATGETGAKAESVNKAGSANADKPALKPATPAATSRRASEAEPPSRRATNAETRAETSARAPASPSVGRRNDDDARAEGASRRARRTEARVATSAPREASTHVVSPAAKSEKRKVIQWP
jgi:hypothetical protein